jgi:DNA-binding beta-propeller fold protein YncE
MGMGALKPYAVSRQSAPRSLLPALLLFLAGCASLPPPGPRKEPVFYPPPPAAPRIQLLTTFSSSSDISAGRGWFRKFVLGPEEDRPIVKPYGIAFWKDRIYICDSILAALVVIDLGKKRLSYLQPTGAGRLLKPINIAIDRDGTKYVTDTARGMVLLLDSQDRYTGELTAEGMKPSDVALDDSRLYVSDLKSQSVRVFDKQSRQPLFSVPLEGEQSPEARLYAPVNLALDGQGNLYVSDLGAFRVQKYDRQGRYLRSFGAQGLVPGRFARPKGVDVDENGLLYVVDAATEVVQIFDPEGRLLLYFGQPGGGDFALNLPAKVRVNKTLLPRFRHLAAASFELDYLVFVISQYGNGKIAVFGMGHGK